MSIPPIEISYQICEETYIFCDLPLITCQKRYDECKSNSNQDLEPGKQSQDNELINGISGCKESFLSCQGGNCINEVRYCLMKTLEEGRQRRLREEIKGITDELEQLEADYEEVFSS